MTGSGKTEVYLAVLDQVLDEGRQVLVLVPEIGLTPQLVARFGKTDGPAEPAIAAFQSARRRARCRRGAERRSGDARLVVGTRSAVFTPLPEPG